MDINIFQVDAFTKNIFSGNPAAVCPLEEFLDDKTLQNIAAENNLSETAFFTPSKEDNSDYHLRWFMPNGEVDLCGHATLASAYVIFNEINAPLKTVRFQTKSGILTVEKSKNRFLLDFPAWQTQKTPIPDDLNGALNITPLSLHEGKYWMAVYENEADLRALKPDFNALKNIENIDFLIATAKSSSKEFDFSSRFFCPKFNVDEDPVTGSAHCITAPYWANKLNKTTLNAYQASQRGGTLMCKIKEDRVILEGQAALYMRGTIYV